LFLVISFQKRQKHKNSHLIDKDVDDCRFRS
jgi:hypothetical protein